jgi:hypothetical protein
MAAKPLPDAELLRKLMRYDPETGRLYWLPRPVEMFKPGNRTQLINWSNWTKKYEGQEVSPSISPASCRGYGQVQIFGQKFLKHRVIWKMMTGEDPIEVDHINGNTADNRWCNLRSVDRSSNLRNRARDSRNSSGCMGVFWSSQFSKWQATINLHGKAYHLGLFKRKEDAIRARKTAERRFGYHPNHDRPLHRGRAA